MKDLKIEITKTWRKSLSLSFDKKWTLQVKAPKFVSSSQIDSFIEKNTSWIEKHYQDILERKKNKKYYLFGEEIDTENIYDFSLWEVDQHKKLERFYKSEAKKYLIPRCEYLAQKHGFSYKWTRITSASTRWGSCSSKKTINFSYRLIMAPRESIDYVIIHELCHLRQMNHSHKFWSEVENIMPEYKIPENHLKTDWWKYTL